MRSLLAWALVAAMGPPAAAGVPPDRALADELARARVDAAAADTALAEATSALPPLRAAADAAAARLAGIDRDAGAVALRLREAREQTVRRAIAAYEGETLGRVNFLLEAGDVNALVRRAGMLAGVVDAGRRAAWAYEQAKRDVDDRRASLGERAVRQARAYRAATERAEAATRSAMDAHVRVAALEAGSQIVVSGFEFPVAGPHAFSDDFGAPRNVGTPYQHTHQGNDVFGAPGTPLVACERGTVSRAGDDPLGGMSLWITGRSGTTYYYAHLSGFAPGLAVGQAVETGALVGFMGDTGDARGGATHLHFEIHPGGGAAVNPYWLLRAVDDADRAATSRPPA